MLSDSGFGLLNSNNLPGTIRKTNRHFASLLVFFFDRPKHSHSIFQSPLESSLSWFHLRSKSHINSDRPAYEVRILEKSDQKRHRLSAFSAKIFIRLILIGVYLPAYADYDVPQYDKNYLLVREHSLTTFFFVVT